MQIMHKSLLMHARTLAHLLTRTRKAYHEIEIKSKLNSNRAHASKPIRIPSYKARLLYNYL